MLLNYTLITITTKHAKKWNQGDDRTLELGMLCVGLITAQLCDKSRQRYSPSSSSPLPPPPGWDRIQTDLHCCQHAMCSFYCSSLLVTYLLTWFNSALQLNEDRVIIGSEHSGFWAEPIAMGETLNYEPVPPLLDNATIPKLINCQWWGHLTNDCPWYGFTSRLQFGQGGWFTQLLSGVATIMDDIWSLLTGIFRICRNRRANSGPAVRSLHQMPEARPCSSSCFKHPCD